MATGLTSKSKAKLRRELCRRSLIDFTRHAWRFVDPAEFQYGRHMEVIAEALQAVSRGEVKRLLINIPPRFCKSTLVSVMWPAWDWVDNPARQFFTLSHQEKLSVRDARKMRALVESQWYQEMWPLSLADDQNEKKTFINEKFGRRQCAGLDSGFTGEGGDIIVIDDPIDRDQAESATELERVNLQFDEKVVNRLNDARTGAIVAIGQRIASSDLFGHLLRRGGWDVLCLPQAYEADHPVKTTMPVGDWRTVEGELLWPERIDVETLASMRQGMTEHSYAGQQQQRPTLREGGMFKHKWLKIVLKLPGPPVRAVRYWDMASTESSGADWTAGVLVALIGDQYVVVDVVRGQWNPTARLAKMRETAELDAQRWKDGQGNDLRVELWEEEEGGATGKEVALNHVQMFATWGLRTERPTGSKQTRAGLALPMVENGFVSLLLGAWNDKFIEELCAFPNGDNDDQVDGFSGSMAKLLTNRRWAIAG